MPAPGTVWASGTWSTTCWAAGTWANAGGGGGGGQGSGIKTVISAGLEVTMTKAS